jgi:membrane protein DedA with SNARE-associated domain
MLHLPLARAAYCRVGRDFAIADPGDIMVWSLFASGLQPEWAWHLMHPLAAAGSTVSSDVWAYVAIFALVAIGWAGVPAIGGAVIAGAAVAASQGSLSIGAVLVVSVIGTGVGGLAGYSIGLRWGRAIMTHPGPWLARRERAIAAGEVVYARWGRLAVFFTPCMVSGIVKMKLFQFAVWNLLAGAVYVLSVGPAAYGAGNVASGQASLGSVGWIVAGVVIGTVAVVLGARYRRRRKGSRAAHVSPGSSADGIQRSAVTGEDG